MGLFRFRMSLSRILFFPTAIVVSIICASVAYRGWQIVRFSEVEGAQLTETDRSAAFEPWGSIEGLMSSARLASFSGELRSNDARAAVQKSGELTEILSVTPISGVHWMLLSAMRSVAREPSVWTIAALAMSNVTAANEGYLMPQRALLAVSLWEILPSDIRRAAANDLALSWKTFTEPRRIQLVDILAAKSPSVRDEIRKSLSGLGPLSVEDLVQLGLQAR